METIKRKSGIKFRESITINGQTLKSPVFARKTDCKQWLANQRAKRVETALYGDLTKLKERLPFREFAERWLDSKRAAGLAASSIENYERYLRVHLIPSLGEADLKRISRHDLEKLQLRLSKSHSPKGLNLILTVLKGILGAAVEDGYLLRNPAKGLRCATESEAVEAFWTKAEIDQFLRANGQDPLYDYYLVALNIGMRRGELAALKWDRVDFSRNQITVSRTMDKRGLRDQTKTRLKRVLPMNQLVRATLLKLVQGKSAADFVFVQVDAQPINTHHIYREFANAQARAGITNKIRFHDLRHTFASQYAMNGGNLFDLQKILGHTDIKMTMRYAHFSPEHLQRAMDGFELGEIGLLTQNPPTATQNGSAGSGELVKLHG